jgi:hypothetical protein
MIRKTELFIVLCVLALAFGLALAGCGNRPNTADFEFQTNPKKADLEIIITGYTGIGETASIPKQIGGKRVTAINHQAFYDNQLTSVTIPRGVTSIGNQAFASNQLTSVTIGANVDMYNSSFDNNLRYYYNINGKRAGTYTYSGGRWTYRQ